MKLSVSAFRAQASAQRKILSSYQNQLNYGACTSFPALGGSASDDRAQMMVDSTAIPPTNATNQHQRPPQHPGDTTDTDKHHPTSDPASRPPVRHPPAPLDKSPARTRSKSNQRWMKLRTTVQLSGAISSTAQKSKGPLKREDSFLKRFSTRQIPETQETVDTGDETETHNGSQAQNEVNRRRKRRRKEMSKTVVNPDENFYFYWLMTVTVCVLYNLWTLIVRQSFPELQRAASAFWYSGDAFTDIIFVCDIIVQFRTGYLEQGLMVYDSKKLATHYLKSRAFALDTLSLLPLDFFQLSIGINPLLRFPRFLKVYRVYTYYYMVESRTVYPNLWRVVNLIHILLILAHWFGCFYYLLSEAEGFHGDWVYPHRPGDYATLTRKYLASLYWSTLTLTTIGDLPTPETNAESRGRSKSMTSSGQSEAIPRRGHKSRLLQFNSNCGYLFTIVSYLIGVFIFATIVGQVGNVITNRNANRLEFERLLDGAKTYMRHHKVPGGMKRRVLRWYDYSWSRGRIQGGGDINTALGLLPDKLKTELALHVNLSVLKKVTIFQECQPEFLHDLVLKMKAYIFTPGDLICRKGEVAREMFIIADGILDVISETGRVLTTMKAGDFFGEIGILNLDGLNKRTADVRSVGYSELFSLSREDVLSAMKDYPEAQDILQSLGRKRLMEAKNAVKVHKAQVRQSRDNESSGDSDTTGKRIVDRLRSDVKGLKKALRRSRRDTRNKGAVDTSRERASAKKHSILRRMSHVQSSDECDAALEQEPIPIGAGLPLLQRLKMLKEKQENERVEKESLRRGGAGGSPGRRGEVICAEASGAAASGPGVVPSTVRTQLTGTRAERAPGKRSFGSAGGVGEAAEAEVKEERIVASERGAAGLETGRSILKERLRAIQDGQGKGKGSSCGTVEEEGTNRNSVGKSFEDQLSVPRAENSVPKIVRNVLEVPMRKDGWELLKRSSISCSKSGRKANAKEGRVVKRVSEKGTYLSKSDTVLERQKTGQRDEEKRSRSVSPLKGSEGLSSPGERRRSRSVGHSPKAGELSDVLSRREFLCPGDHSGGNSPTRMKKYNSISDLSPEYSGLPFVKKLKILNERQKLEELEKELVVRSVSLDASERPRSKAGNSLVRSQSEASKTEGRSAETSERRSAVVRLGAGRECCGSRATTQWDSRPLASESKREEGSTWRCSEGSIASPESNETLERRHLKSILKKLSGEGSASDEDRGLRGLERRSSPWKREESTEFRKLMREPTMEGYVARHKKLTKSVTFDSDTLPSPLDAVLEQPPEEASIRGYPPMSPAAVLTLQLSNLSMMPIAGPKKMSRPGEQDEGEKFGDVESPDMQTKVTGLTHPQEDLRLNNPSDLQNKPKSNLHTSSSNQDFIQKNITSPSVNSEDQQLFAEIQGQIFLIYKQLLEKAQDNFRSQLDSLQQELNRRDETITRLQSKLMDMETNHLHRCQNTWLGQVSEKYSEDGAPLSDFSDAPLKREHSWERVSNSVGAWLGDSGGDGGSVGASPEEAEGTSGDRLVAPSRDDVSGSAADRLTVVHDDGEERDAQREKVWVVRRRGGVTAEGEGTTESGKWMRAKCGRGKRYAEGRRKAEKVAKGSFMNRLNRLQRSVSSCQESSAEFVVLNIDESSNSSDMENVDNRDWEVQMLVEELAKKDPFWQVEEKVESEAEGDIGHSEDVRKLREEVNTLKRVVCDSDLSRLTNSEMDILESIIEAKDQKILQISKSSSLDNCEKNNMGKATTSVGASGAENKTKENGQLKKSLKHKIGKALSFDFHDMDSRRAKAPKNVKPRRSGSRGQKTTSASHRKHHSLYNLWRTSTRLRTLVLDDSERNLTVSGPLSASSRSSLPILNSKAPNQEKGSTLRASLPLLSAKDFGPNACQCLTSSPVALRSPTFIDEPAREFELPPTTETPESRASPSGGLSRHSDVHPMNHLNSFIKSVGQKVKQVMTGEISTARTQVPTISKLLEEQCTAKSTDMEMSENLEGLNTGPSSSASARESSTTLGSFDCDRKTDPQDH